MNQGETSQGKRRVNDHPEAGGAPDPAQTARNKPAVVRLNVRLTQHCLIPLRAPGRNLPLDHHMTRDGVVLERIH